MNTENNINQETKPTQERAILVGAHTARFDYINDTDDNSMEELASLAQTAGAEVLASIIQNRVRIDNGTYIGDGKLEEVLEAVENMEANLVIFDDELSPMQLKNIGDVLKVKVLDRTALILDIFASRALSSEGKLQVELAQLRYMLPRLAGIGVSLSRAGGGIGARGPGETKLETSRRHVRRRLEHLEDQLKEVKQHRALIRSRRIKNNSIVLSLAGYTNSGKSTLMNLLTNSDLYAENKLFATLDATVRGFSLNDGRQIMLFDTVGFIRKLPHQLVRAFASTLEEITFADVILHVIDVSNPEYTDQIKVVNNILEDINKDKKPVIAVLNKLDAVDDPLGFNTNVDGAVASVAISAKTGEGIDKLLELIGQYAPGAKKRCKLLIPFDKGNILSPLHKDNIVESEQYVENGTLIDVWIDSVTYNKLREYIIED